MQSLRSRKPTGEPARQRSVARPGAPRTLQRPANSKDARKSRVDDKIKKRMSMRYADISMPRGADVPDMPTFPVGMAPGRGDVGGQDDAVRDVGRVRQEDVKAAELKMLDEKTFDPDAYLKLKLANSTEAELKSLQSSLQNTKDDTNADLQRNVFKNYAEFVHISKEISTLENEMLELKESLSEWRNMPSLLHIDENASVAERRRNVRSSVADLRVLYASQMQSLHAQIEGSTKFVPTVPGRHVVAEMENGILALNAATYKPSHGVRFVLLDDAVLVARRKQRREGREGREGRWVAERCWPLNEMLVLDTKDSASMTNVFKIRHGKETHVYRTEVQADKKQLLAQFRHIADELATKRRKEREGEHERRKTMFGGNDIDRSGGAFPDWMAELAQKAGMSDSAKEKAERDTRWVSEFSDELTVAIALRDFDKAAELVEEGESKIAITPGLSAKLPVLTASLTSALLTALSAPTNRKQGVVHLVSLLVRLHAAPAARNTFLSMRSEMMRKRVRSIRFEGSVEMYVNDLAVVMFTCLKHTADWFLASFKENDVASGFIEWAKKQIVTFSELFRRQVYSSDADPEMIAQARQIAFGQSKKLLEEYGLDFRYLLNDLLSEHPKALSHNLTQEAPRRPMPAVKRHSIPRPEAGRTPASTPIRVRSPEPPRRTPADSTPPKSSTPAPSVKGASPAETPRRATPDSTQSKPWTAAPPIRSPEPRSAVPAPLLRERSRAPSPSSSSRAPSPTLSVVSTRSEGGVRRARTRSPRPPPLPAADPANAPPIPAAPRTAYSTTGEMPTRPILRPMRSAARPSISRPGSAQSEAPGQVRPPPVAIPRREGMF